MSGDLKCIMATWRQFLEEPLEIQGMLDLVRVRQKVNSFKTWLQSLASLRKLFKIMLQVQPVKWLS